MDTDRWIIFDFDNTLADTMQAWIACYNVAAQRHGYHVVTPEDQPVLRHKSAFEIRKALGVPWWRIAGMRAEVRKIYSEQGINIDFIPSIAGVLKELSRRGYRLGILTSSSEQYMRAFLQKRGYQSLFEFVETNASLFSKNWRLKKLLRRYKIGAAHAAYVGDEIKDIKAAKRAGVFAVAVTWGGNSRESLEAEHPDYVVNKPEDLLNISI